MSVIEVIDTYKDNLRKYSLKQLRYISAEGTWSICQMYDHIIVVAHEYIDKVEACAVSEEEQVLGKTKSGEHLFEIGGFPPIKIKLPDELNSPPYNLDSRENLSFRLEQVRERLKQWESKVDTININYKMKHGGFGWLNAREWYDLVGMHFRHHFRQLRELEQKLETVDPL
ncbi:DinB family protein [Robertmurraya yapensis]|uniref:DinB family protein n=1 Tax=Bacillus yapensis TaxID=2492960 RepID=A0A431WKS9_9BACI|nr:DinB family protein [Bacillus yapensis]RTR36218.1 DinB family protein [Bacillus yapensis]TKT05721.1 DinB family protein [Bacillus yapensis]